MLIHKVFEIKNQISKRLKNLSSFTIIGDCLRAMSPKGESCHNKECFFKKYQRRDNTLFYPKEKHVEKFYLLSIYFRTRVR